MGHGLLRARGGRAQAVPGRPHTQHRGPRERAGGGALQARRRPGPPRGAERGRPPRGRGRAARVPDAADELPGRRRRRGRAEPDGRGREPGADLLRHAARAAPGAHAPRPRLLHRAGAVGRGRRGRLPARGGAQRQEGGERRGLRREPPLRRHAGRADCGPPRRLQGGGAREDRRGVHRRLPGRREAAQRAPPRRGARGRPPRQLRRVGPRGREGDRAGGAPALVRLHREPAERNQGLPDEAEGRRPRGRGPGERVSACEDRPQSQRY
mmetsp:Transcript_122303/g.346753  ORF Transcript_122303/g.346753 Transcript_122303/m.346753 type:complete len:268 (+) Transcript_122303:108-911(+)